MLWITQNVCKTKFICQKTSVFFLSSKIGLCVDLRNKKFLNNKLLAYPLFAFSFTTKIFCCITKYVFFFIASLCSFLGSFTKNLLKDVLLNDERQQQAIIVDHEQLRREQVCFEGSERSLQWIIHVLWRRRDVLSYDVCRWISSDCDSR